MIWLLCINGGLTRDILTASKARLRNLPAEMFEQRNIVKLAQVHSLPELPMIIFNLIHIS